MLHDKIISQALHYASFDSKKSSGIQSHCTFMITVLLDPLIIFITMFNTGETNLCKCYDLNTSRYLMCKGFNCTMNIHLERLQFIMHGRVQVLLIVHILFQPF